MELVTLVNEIAALVNAASAAIGRDEELAAEGCLKKVWILLVDQYPPVADPDTLKTEEKTDDQ